MGSVSFTIMPYRAEQRAQVIALSLRAWAPVFAGMAANVPGFVYRNFYPGGWEARQRADVGRLLDEEAGQIRVAVEGDTVLGWIGIRLHPEDSLGEIHILAADPPHQKRGIARALIGSAESEIRDAGMAMVMVETGGDPGHAPARACYEGAGYVTWAVARYFKPL